MGNRRGVRRGGDEGRGREREAGFVSLGQELSAQERFQVCVKGGIWRSGQTWSGWQVAGSSRAPVCLLARDLSHLIEQVSGL